jgi:hypothetical protein
LRSLGWFGINKVVVDNVSNGSRDEEEDGFYPHQTAFMAERRRNTTQWRIKYNGTVYDRKIYPTVGGSYGNSWVAAIVDFASRDDDAHYDEIDFFFGCDIPSLVEGKHDALRCHPDFHSYPWERRPWHDWIMVRWESSPTGRTYDHAAKLLLWACLRDTASLKHKLVCAIHSLRSAQPTPDATLPFFIGDVIDRRIRVIPASMVLEVAYVLPTVRNANDAFPDSVDEADYFVVIPPRSTWMEAGLQMIEEYIKD